jgi:hypothetical protein
VVPQFAQNFAPAGFSKPQFGQNMDTPTVPETGITLQGFFSNVL